MPHTRYIVGSDIGGTFTDIVYLDAVTGRQLIAKVPSTPPNYINGLMNALKKIGVSPLDVETISHGSTIATNAIVQRAGAKTGLLTTRGFRDVLLAARADREVMYDLSWDPPPPLVLRRNILTATERISYEGKILESLNEDEVRNAAKIFKKRKMEAIGVCFINSFMNSIHERRAKEILKEEYPSAYVCASYELLPEIREFERMSTTVANAYLGPIVESYLLELTSRLRNWGYLGDVLVTHCGGGVMTIEHATKIPVRTCHSSPVSGAIGLGAFIGDMVGFKNTITFEMGGTSTDVCLFYKGAPLMTYEWRVQFNVPVLFPAIDAVYIGAGGGSIAWIDPGGALKVGPQSAGARPGPACYDLGGVDPTITDAQLVLQRLNPNYFLGGEMTIKEGIAHEAVKKYVAEFYKWEVEEAADGIIRVAISNMVNAVRLISVQRGYDPRDFGLVSYGGCGPMHAVDVARELGIPTVAIPTLPGYASAFGTLRIDVRHDFVRPILQTEKEIDIDKINKAYADMEAEAIATMKKSKIPEDKVTIQRLADIKYYDQSSYLTIPVLGGILKAKDMDEITKAFLEAHQRKFGYTMPPGYADVEVVNVRTAVYGVTPKPGLKRRVVRGEAEAASKGRRDVYFKKSGGFTETLIYERTKLPVGAMIEGPAVVEQPDSTIVIPPQTTATVDEYLIIIKVT